MDIQAIIWSLLLGAGFGALMTALLFGRRNRSILNGAGAGAVAGALGGQILMLPLQHCPFVYDAEVVAEVGTRFTGTFWFGVGVVFVSSLTLLVPVWVWVQQGGKLITNGERGRTERFGRSILPYLFLLPTVIILVIFLYWPMIKVILMSLETSFLGLNARFVCVDNYLNLMESERYIRSFLVTSGIMLAIVVVGMGMALMISVLTNQNIRYAGVYRTLLIWPYALSPVISGLIFLMMFNPQVGVVNQFLYSTFGIRPSWFSDPTLAPWVIILTSVWNNLGFNILFYIAGLQSIPGSLLEAASIDGANAVQRFFRITFPLLSPYSFFLLITNVTYAFYGIFGAVDTLTQGGPRGATAVLIYKLYEDAFEYTNKTGSAAAQSLILFLLVAGLTIIQFRYVERRVTYGE
jgi:sn-glycerol 3-phosphate transport system permease protein